MTFLERIYDMDDTEVAIGKTQLKSSIDLDIDDKGNVDLNDHGKEGVVTMVAIHGLSRTGSNFTPRPFIDNAEYTFGYEFAKGKDGTVSVTKTELSKKRHESYIKYIEDSGLAKSDKVVAKYLELLKSGLYEAIIAGQSESTVALINKMILTFGNAIRICSPKGALAELYADKFMPKSDAKTFCSFTGKMGTLNAHNPPSLKHMHGGGTIPVQMFCSNSTRYSSLLNYGIENLDESPISAEAFMRIHRNLQNVLDNANGHFYYTKIPSFLMNSSKSSYIILFSDQNIDAERVVSAMIASPMGEKALQNYGFNDEDEASEMEVTEESDAVDEDTSTRASEYVYNAYTNLLKGYSTQVDSDATMTLYTIHCGQARWSVTDERTLSVKELMDNINQWFADITVGKDHFSIWELVRSMCAPKEKGMPSMYEALLMAALFRKELPSIILRKVTTRITSNTGIAKRAQLGLMKLAYNQYARNNNLKEITPMLDHTNKSYPYNLGRLMAITEYAQKKTNPNVTSTISLGKSKLAVMRPIHCEAMLQDGFTRVYMPSIIKRENANDKLPRTSVWLSKIHDEINEGLSDPFVRRMTPEEQCLFHHGFRAQMNDLYTKKNSTPNKE